MSFFDPPPSLRKRPQIGYGSFFDNQAPELDETALTPEQREALLESIGGRSQQAAESLLALLDTPGAYFRGLLAGRPGERVSGGGLLDAIGLRPDKELFGGWARPIADFTTEALLDPLNAVGGGISKAGLAARAVSTASKGNMLDDAVRVASKAAIQSGALDSAHAKNALSFWDEAGKGASDLTDADLLTRPVIGSSTARRSTTLGDVIQAQPDVNEAIERVNNFLKKNGGGDYSSLAGETLSKDLGLYVPFTERMIAGVNLPGGAGMAAGMDRMKQALRWSAPLRYGHALFNKDVFGGTDELSQVFGQQLANSMREGDEIGRRKVADALQVLEPDVTTGPNAAALGASLRRILRGVPEPQDLAYITPGNPAYRPDFDRFNQLWNGDGTGPGLVHDYIGRRADHGMASQSYRSKYGEKYFPRHVDNLSFLSKIEEEGLRGFKKGRAFSGMTGDQLPRRDFMDVPGGDDLLNELSGDLNVAGPNRTYKSIDAAASYIKLRIEAEANRLFPNGVMPDGTPVPEYTTKAARRLARVLSQLDADAVKNKLPMFGSHPVDDFARYVTGNERAMKVNENLFDIIASTAKQQPWADVEGTNFFSLNKAMKDLQLRTVKTATPGASMIPMDIGAAPEIIRRLEARFPGQQIDLKDFSIDGKVLRRLSKLADFYDRPEAHNWMLKAFDSITRVWKGSVLSWPARFTRDWYSGAFSNIVEVGDPLAFYKGYEGAKHLLQGDWDKLDAVLAEIPKYSQMVPAQRKKAFMQDTAGTGVLGGRQTMDTTDAMRAITTGEDVAHEFLPGIDQRTTLGYQATDLLSGNVPLGPQHAAYSELGKGWNKFFDMGFDRPKDVGNPILRWGAKLGDTTDEINRSAGFIGLLLTGVDPTEAAKRIKAAHVDYNSLTKFEREQIRRVAPFWAYTSRTGKWVANQLLEHPGGRFTQFGLRAPNVFLGEDDQYVPDSIRSSYGMPASDAMARPFGGLTEGVQPWITDIDLPGIDQINMLQMAYQPSGRPDLAKTAWDTGKELVSKQAHPWIRSGIEAITGENLYTKKPAKEFTPAVSELAEDLGIPKDSVYGRYIKSSAPFLDAIPFVPRGFQLYNRLSDEEKVPDMRDRAYQTAVNAFSGVKFQNVDDQSRRIDARRKIGEVMEEDPLVRSFTQPYLPVEARPFADPRLLQMMALDRQLARELKRERDLKAGVPVKAPKRPRNTDPASFFE